MPAGLFAEGRLSSNLSTDQLLTSVPARAGLPDLPRLHCSLPSACQASDTHQEPPATGEPQRLAQELAVHQFGEGQPSLVEKTELAGTLPLHVYDETAPLRTISLWGLPGPEVVLAQLLSPQENLFYSQFDIQGARQEYARLLDFLFEKGVGVILVQDLLLSSIDPERLADKEMIPRSLNRLITDIQDRGLELFRRHGVGNLDTLDLVPELVREDVDRLGEWPAIVLNWMLSLRHICPSGNIFYGRDQSNVLGDKLFWSQMRWPIRKPEVGMYKLALESRIPQDRHHRVRGKGAFLEGGDGIMVDGNCYLGVGGRTTMAGAIEVYGGLKDYLNKHDKELVLVVDQEAERRSHGQRQPGEEQTAMHLDTFWMPFGRGKSVLCCTEVARERTVMFIHDDNGHIQVKPWGSFLDYLETKGFGIFDISREEQLRYATNFLNLDGQTVIVPFSDNTSAMSHLDSQHITTLPVEMKQLGGGYGAIHCMTSAFERG